jgi:hypothetical protein
VVCVEKEDLSKWFEWKGECSRWNKSGSTGCMVKELGPHRQELGFLPWKGSRSEFWRQQPGCSIRDRLMSASVDGK